MIFVTVGTQLPFPRLINAMNALAANLDEHVVAQTSGLETTNNGAWDNLVIHNTLTPAEFEQMFTTARIIVAHAGIGTILSAKTHQKPLILLPRRHALNEHRNDHQLATARYVENLTGVQIAWQVEDIAPMLEVREPEPASLSPSPSHAALLAHIKEFIDG